MSGTPAWRAVPIALGAAALLALAAGGVRAGTGFTPQSNDEGSSHGINYRSATEASVPAVAQAIAVAYCPDERQLTGGGLLISGDSLQAFMNDTGPFGFGGHTRREQWRGSGTNFDGADKSFTAYAICKRTGGMQLRTGERMLSADQTGNLKARCPAGTQVTGGGVVDSANEFPGVQGSAPFDSGDANGAPEDGWKVRMWNNTAGPIDLTAYALCSEGLGLAYKFASRLDIAAGAVGNPVVQCGADQAVVGGGGWIQDSGPDTFLNSMYPVDRDDAGAAPDDGFSVYGANLAGDPRDISAYGICKT